jgi:3-deoxy-7-phosphoheptulonate synthase
METRIFDPMGLKERIPAGLQARACVLSNRRKIQGLLEWKDPRLLAIVGPCSIDDPETALAYAQRLSALSKRLASVFVIAMRVFVEKSGSPSGWKGFAQDPGRDGDCDVFEGIERSRGLMAGITKLELGIAAEIANPSSFRAWDDLLSYGIIGARNCESRTHREIASGLPFPIGFKNSLEGSIRSAALAASAASKPSRFIGTDPEGRLSLIDACGNPHAHLILRGSRRGPNYDPASVNEAANSMEGEGLKACVLIDANHDNSAGNPNRQVDVVFDIVRRRTSGENAIRGFMLESYFKTGSVRDSLDGKSMQGLSVTDPCLGWDETEKLLHEAGRMFSQRGK